MEILEETIMSDDEDIIGIGMDDKNDEDYVPDIRPKNSDGLKKVQEVLMSGNNDMQIKLEVLDENQEVSSTTVDQRLDQRKNLKKKDSDFPSIIPQMVRTLS